MVARCPVLVERDDELRTLSRIASEGRVRLVAITGEAGTGKSRLASEFAESLPEAWTARTVTVTRTTPPELPNARLVILDDAHFLDPGALGALLERGGLTVLTFRLGLHPAGSAELRALAALVADPRACELRLMPLSPAGVAQMAAAMGRYTASDVYGRSGGNAFWAEQLLGGSEIVPWTVVEAVTSRLDALPDAAQELACALAVAEEALPPAAGARVVADIDAAWAALADAGLVGADLSLRHALVGEAVRARLGPDERARWHRRLAAALEPEAVPPDRLARHWAAAGEAERAAAIARDAATALRAQGATRRAFDCFEIALACPAEGAVYEEAAVTAARIGEFPTMQRWIVAAEQAYRAAGQPDRAVRMRLDPAFDYLPIRRTAAIRDEPVERLLIDAQAAMAAADGEAARGLIATAVSTARERGDAMALARAARMTMFSLGEFERGEALLDEALALCTQPGHESRVLTTHAVGRFAQGYPLEALEEMRRAVAISRQEADAVRWTGHVALANTLVQTGSVAEGVATMKAAMGDLPSAAPMHAIADGVGAFEAGDLEDGLAAITGGTDALLTAFDFDPLGRAVAAAHILNVRALAEIHGGRPEAALRTVRRLDALSPEPFSDVAGDTAYVLARTGEGEEARRRIADLARVASGPGVMAMVEAVHAFTGSGERSRHLQAAAELMERAPRLMLAAELWCEAALVGVPGALERARRLCAEHGLRRVGARVAAIDEQPPAPTRFAQLTLREREVVELAAEGLTNREIGERLYLSEGTVRNYLSTAFAKLGVSRRAELGRLVAN